MSKVPVKPKKVTFHDLLDPKVLEEWLGPEGVARLPKPPKWIERRLGAALVLVVGHIEDRFSEYRFQLARDWRTNPMNQHKPQTRKQFVSECLRLEDAG